MKFSLVAILSIVSVVAASPIDNSAAMVEAQVMYCYCLTSARNVSFVNYDKRNGALYSSYYLVKEAINLSNWEKMYHKLFALLLDLLEEHLPVLEAQYWVGKPKPGELLLWYFYSLLEFEAQTPMEKSSLIRVDNRSGIECCLGSMKQAMYPKNVPHLSARIAATSSITRLAIPDVAQARKRRGSVSRLHRSRSRTQMIEAKDAQRV
ncbi:hypothetical protein NLG97_g3713 [Lecanicillium saksenae]|uniref:Uncharacterized protein n=1 Tax=Lecanicillium saksenae TaxID=468837 RepID=A0ACC1R0J1_9HYPO|nr:hypothetical protein NLG97_g3713 [Lecanicillium saksenae]